MTLVVATFPSGAVANAARVKQTLGRVQSDTKQRVIIIPAPGKRHVEDGTISDLLRFWVDGGQQHRQHVIRLITARFNNIITVCDIDFDLRRAMKAMLTEASHLEAFDTGVFEQFMISRGSWLMAQIFAKACGFAFVDAQEFVVLNRTTLALDLDRTLAFAKRIRIHDMLAGGIVIPACYGRLLGSRTIHTLPHDHFEETGAIVADFLKTEHKTWLED